MTLIRPTRRAFLATTTAFLAAPAISRAATRPVFTHGVQSGDIDTSSGMIWTRTDRPALIEMEISTTESFSNAHAVAPIDAIPNSDMAVKRLVDNLPSDQDIFYRFTAADLSDINARSEPIIGKFRTAPMSRRDVRFAWSRSEEHTSELQSRPHISYAVFCLKKKKKTQDLCNRTKWHIKH